MADPKASPGKNKTRVRSGARAAVAETALLDPAPSQSNHPEPAPTARQAAPCTIEEVLATLQAYTVQPLSCLDEMISVTETLPLSPSDFELSFTSEESDGQDGQTATIHPIPGLTMIGRGMKYFPGSPYMLKQIVLPRTTDSAGDHRALFYFPALKRYYWYLDGIAVDPSPPMPEGAWLNHTIVESSFQRMVETTSKAENVDLTSTLFLDSSDASLSQMQYETDTYYGQKTLFVPLWSLYFPQIPISYKILKKLAEMIPETFIKFKPGGGNLEDMERQKRLFDYIFDTFGTHYIQRVWVGGRVTVTVATNKSSNMTMDQVRAALSMAFANQTSQSQSSLQTLLENSEVRVSGEGGALSLLAQLSQLDESKYDKWLTTVNEAPALIGFEVGGLWQLLANFAQIVSQVEGDTYLPEPEFWQKRADNLARAYQYKTMFHAVTSVVHYRNSLLISRGGLTIELPLPVETPTYSTTGPSSPEIWEVLNRLAPFDSILSLETDLDAWGFPLVAGYVPSLVRPIWFVFKERSFLLVDPEIRQEITDWLPIHGSDRFGRPYWPGLPFERIDACFWDMNRKIYFFYGDGYARFDLHERRTEAGYPKQIEGNWQGVNFTRIDSAVMLGTWVYLFSQNYYAIFDMVPYTTLPNYPKLLRGVYSSDWNIPLPPIY